MAARYADEVSWERLSQDFGVPHPALFGVLTGVLSAIPFASPLVFIGAALWLMTQAVAAAAIGLLVFGSVVVLVADQVSNLSKAFELAPGDIIYSGTPENVGPVVRGDVMLGHIDGLPEISVRVA